MPAGPQEIQAVFLAAVGRPESERATILDRACGTDTELRRRVEALLKSHDAAGSFLSKPAVQDAVEELTGQRVADTSPVAEGLEDRLDFLAPSEMPGVLGRLAHYEATQVLGRGGMGVVLKAYDAKLQRIVAIKVMAPQLATSASARKRFVREAQAAAAVRNEHIIDIYAVEEANGLPYLVMEYVDGPSLQHRLDSTGPLELKEILRIGMQTAAGLAAAHAQGLVHRDIKPANILLENGVERVRITDFGLARAADDARLTRSGVIAGTPQYMAPEQAGEEPLDCRADLFSLGSVLYAMATGRPPFRGSGTLAVLKRVREDTPESLRCINPELPEWLIEIVNKLHAKDPADRFQSAAEVADLLGRHLAYLQDPAQPPPPRIAAPSGAPTKVRLRRRHRWFFAAAAVLLLLGALGAAEAVGVTRVAATIIRVFTPEGTVESVSKKDQVGEILRFQGPKQETRCLAVSPDGRRALIGKGWASAEFQAPSDAPYPVLLVDLETGRELCTFKGHTAPVVAVAFHRDGRHAVSADSVIRVWELETGKEIRTFGLQPQGLYSVTFSADGRWVATGGRDTIVRLWDLDTEAELRRFEGLMDVPWSLAISADGGRLLAGCGGDHIGAKYINPRGKTLRLWDTASGETIHSFGGYSLPVNSVAFSPDGRFAVSGGGNPQLRLWETESGKLVRSFEGHTDTIASVAVSPDRRFLLSGATNQAHAADGTVRLWNLETGEEVTRFLAHPASVRTVVFTPDGRRALSGGYNDGLVRLWRLPQVKLQSK